MRSKTDELKILIREKWDVVPFLKELTKSEKKELLPTIGELHKKYHTRKRLWKIDSYGRKYETNGDYNFPQIHRDLVLQAGVVCARTVAEFREHVGWQPGRQVIEDHIVEKILPWHVPSWFNREVNRLLFAGLPYLKMLDLQKKGYLQPTEQLIVSSLIHSLVQYKGEGKAMKAVYCLDELYLHQETLDTHFWLLFEVPGGINNFSRGVTGRDFIDNNPWNDAIIELTGQGKVSRKKVLQACLLSCTKGFSKYQISWFFKLFKLLQPSEAEYIEIQPELFTCLNSDSATAIKSSLAIIKSLYRNEAFDYNGLLSSAPQLLSSPTKATVNTTLTLLDKLAAKHKDRQTEICEIFMNALAYEDQKIQVKTAKLIHKYGAGNQEIGVQIEPFYSLLFTDAKTILKPYLPKDFEEDTLLEEMEVEELQLISEENRIEQFDTYDELVYFVSQVFDDHEAHHVEQLMDCLPKIKALLTAKNADKLSQAFIRALKVLWGHQTWSTSFLTSAAYYLNDFASMLEEELPGCLPGRKAYLEKKLAEHVYYQDKFKSLNQREHNIPLFDITDGLFIRSLALMKDGHQVSLLSMPTHLPAWIDLSILVDRILEYEEKKIAIDLVDWQIALFRLPLMKGHEEVLEKIASIQQEHIRDVLFYFCDAVELDLSKFNQPDFYLPAILNKGKGTDLKAYQSYTKIDLTHLVPRFSWRYGEVRFISGDYDRKNRTFFDVIKTKQILFVQELYPAIEVIKEEKPASGVFEFVKRIVNPTEAGARPKYQYRNPEARKPAGFFHNYDFGNRKSTHPRTYYAYLPAIDAKRVLMWTPSHYTYYLSLVIQHKMETSEIMGEDNKRAIINVLEFLNEAWYQKNRPDIDYLFLAACFLCNNKTARQLVAELWLKANEYQVFDNQKLGAIAGQLLSAKYGPLKRLTDLFSSTMYNVSVSHNQALEELIGHLIINMIDTPITNTKKLLEIYLELTGKNEQLDLGEIRKKLELWKSSKSLKPIINKLLKKHQSYAG